MSGRTIVNGKITERDGTTRPVNDTGLRVSTPSYPTDSVLIDAFTAVQLGLFEIVAASNIQSVDRLDYLRNGKVDSRSVKWKTIYLDWPNPEDDLVIPSATIRLQDDAVYDADTFTTDIDGDEERDVVNGSIILKVAKMQCVLLIDCVLGTKDDRAAVRRSLEDILLDEPSGDERGRRVLAPWYYNQLLRYQLVGFDLPDSPETAHGKQWALVARVECEAPVVRLVRAPSKFRPLVDLQVGDSIDPNCDT